MAKIDIKPIGYVRVNEGNFYLEIEKKYIPALKGIEDFSNIHVIWWGNLYDDAEQRNILTAEKPYKKSPNVLGVFSTRSPVRPNPILITVVYVFNIDFENGMIEIPYIDAEDGTPILDLKPYHPSADRIKDVAVPDWCSHWPKWLEDSANFNWEEEFTFME